MDCCGMPMAAWPGGGYVCRRCQAKVGVSWVRDRNPFARCVENPAVLDMEPEPEPVYAMPVVEPRLDAAALRATEDLLDRAAAAVETQKVPRGRFGRNIKG